MKELPKKLDIMGLTWKVELSKIAADASSALFQVLKDNKIKFYE